MKPYFRDEHPERLVALCAEAARWAGTPFFPNSSTPGPKGGVSCQKLVAALYQGAGFWNVQAPDVAMSHARFNDNSLAVAFLEGLPNFQRYAVADVPTVRSGDLLGFRLHNTTHHLGICVGPGVFVHAIEHLGTCQSALADPTWGRRLTNLWRPVEP